MKNYKELTNNEMQKIQGGTNFGTCVLGAYGAAIDSALNGKGKWAGPIGIAGTALWNEIKYMKNNKCFG